jgi:endonuclease G
MMLRRLTRALLCLLLVCLPARAADVDLLPGNPSQERPYASQTHNYLMDKRDFTLSYNGRTATLTWESWHLTTSCLGDAPRKPQFDPDETLPSVCTKMVHRD